MRRTIFILLLASVSLLTACSYGTDFAVVNRSGHPIEVRYKTKEPVSNLSSDLPYAAGVPAKTSVSQLNDVDSWRELAVNQYHVDRDPVSLTATATVRVMPGEALRITSILEYDSYVTTGRAVSFPFEEITVSGPDSELRLTGEQARKAFVRNSANLYTLTYN